MTNKDYFTSLLGFSPGPNVAEGALLDAGITGGETYVSSNRAIMLPFVVRVIRVLLSTADTSNSVTGFAIKYDRAAISRLAAMYEEELNEPLGPTVRARNVW